MRIFVDSPNDHHSLEIQNMVLLQLNCLLKNQYINDSPVPFYLDDRASKIFVEENEYLKTSVFFFQEEKVAQGVICMVDVPTKI